MFFMTSQLLGRHVMFHSWEGGKHTVLHSAYFAFYFTLLDDACQSVNSTVVSPLVITECFDRQGGVIVCEV